MVVLGQVVLAPYDRVVMGAELLLFRWKALVSADTPPPPSAEEAVMEFKEALQVCVQYADFWEWPKMISRDRFVWM